MVPDIFFYFPIMSRYNRNIYFHHKNGCTVWFFVIKINICFVDIEDRMHLDSHAFILDKMAVFFEILLI